MCVCVSRWTLNALFFGVEDSSSSDKSYRSYTKRFTISFVTTSRSGWSLRWLLVEPELLAAAALHCDFKTVVEVASARTDLSAPRATRLLRNIKYGSVLHLMVSVAVTEIGVCLCITVDAKEEIRTPPNLKRSILCSHILYVFACCSPFRVLGSTAAMVVLDISEGPASEAAGG